MASSPRYGLTVTASAPSTSYSAAAWRAAVVPMSPRFASATNGTSAGTSARSRSSTAIPSAPYASKKARFGLTAVATGSDASSRSRAKRSTPASVAGKPAGRAVASGSIPTHSTDRVTAVRAASRSR